MRLSLSRIARRGFALSGYGLVQPGGGVAPGRPGGPECLWFVSPQPQPGRAPVVLSLGAWAGGLTVNSFTSSSVFRVASLVSFARSVTASWIDAFAVAIPCSEFSRPTDEACSGSDTFIAVSVRVETDAVVAGDVVPSLVDA